MKFPPSWYHIDFHPPTENPARWLVVLQNDKLKYRRLISAKFQRCILNEYGQLIPICAWVGGDWPSCPRMHTAISLKFRRQVNHSLIRNPLAHESQLTDFIIRRKKKHSWLVCCLRLLSIHMRLGGQQLVPEMAWSELVPVRSGLTLGYLIYAHLFPSVYYTFTVYSL